MSGKPSSTLSAETLVSRSCSDRGRERAALPCLSILAHPDPRRVGDRVLLTGLLMRRPFELARGHGHFTPAAGGEPSVLADPHISRAPLVLRAASTAGSVRIEVPPGFSLHANGRRVSEEQLEVGAPELASGVVLRLGSKTALLLHLTSDPPRVPLLGLLGESDAIRTLRARVLRAADSDTPVLITGETGTGKELVARALHRNGDRRHGPFVAVNMATLTDAIAPSTLFGHTRGAFTGADGRHRGLFERADGGVLFLDEIGETPTAVQPMLLRALETGCYTPVGAEREQRANVRVVAATDASLESDVEAGHFRRALYHRLGSRSLHVEPLRERRVDIPLLLAHFLAPTLQTAPVSGVRAQPIHVAALEHLLDHPFPGNVRELRNLARGLQDGEALDSLLGKRAAEPGASSRACAPPGATQGATQAAPRPRGDTVRDTPLDEARLLQALRDNDFKPDAAARQLGVPSGTIHYLIERSTRLRRARDIGDDEIRSAVQKCDGDVGAAARMLEVSARGLRMVIKQRRLAPDGPLS